MENRKFVIKRAIEETANRDGVVTPDAVVDAARNKNNPLHGEFEWDDSKAAHQHRLAQARALIREVRYVSLDVTESVVRTVAYVHDPRLPPKTQGYISLTSAARDKKLAADVIMAELNRCDAALERAEAIADILDVGTRIDELRALVNDMKTEIAKQSQPKPAARSRMRNRDRARSENRPSA